MDFSKLSKKHLPLLSLWYEDEKAKAQLEGKFPLEQWVAYVNNTPNYFSWIIYEDNTPVGNIALEIDPTTSSGHVSILTSPYLYDMGYENAMLQELFRRPEIRHIHTLHVWIDAQNTPSIRLFEKLEFIRHTSDNGVLEFTHNLS